MDDHAWEGSEPLMSVRPEGGAPAQPAGGFVLTGISSVIKSISGYMHRLLALKHAGVLMI